MSARLRATSATLTLAAAISAIAVANAKAVTPTTNGCKAPPLVTSAIPADAPTLTQQDVDCFAWQEFIALNWPANSKTCAADPRATAATFGSPTNKGLVVWQTYKSANEIFLPHAKRPQAWCEPQVAAAAPDATRPYRLSAIDKFVGGPDLDLHKFRQASPNDSFLTDQSGHRTMYDIRVNQDEFRYIFDNQLYNAAMQQVVASSIAGLLLPDGSTGTTQIGSIELKAAWIELDNPADWPHFLTTRATVTYPGQQPRHVTMGLVGLHIIHKTVSAQQFIWATFEHVDNAPSVADIRRGARGPYIYFHPDCQAATDHYQCKWNAGAPQNTPKVGRDPYGAPVQVVRQQPLASSGVVSVVGLNAWVQHAIAAANPQSVFRYYELVNVLWPLNGRPGPPPGSRTPLPNGNAQPPFPQAVANTTLETYVQSDTCLTCHTEAPVASTTSKSPLLTIIPPQARSKLASLLANAPYGADYSFLLSRAQMPAGGGGADWATVGGAIALVAAAGGFVLYRRRTRSEPAEPAF